MPQPPRVKMTTHATASLPAPNRLLADAVDLLDLGVSTAVGAGGLALAFTNVVVDSRCPAGVTCVWSGMVVVEPESAAEYQVSLPVRPETTAR
jgi:hypothetical protein